MGNCSGNCSACSGCARELVLTQKEIDFLNILAQYAFLPVARKADDMIPVYLEDCDYTPEQYSLILQHLERKGLISVDYDRPLKGFDMAAYKRWCVHGSMALTQRGQQVVELLDVQGID